MLSSTKGSVLVLKWVTLYTEGQRKYNTCQVPEMLKIFEHIHNQVTFITAKEHCDMAFEKEVSV